jgi:hypothetical protein
VSEGPSVAAAWRTAETGSGLLPYPTRIRCLQAPDSCCSAGRVQARRCGEAPPAQRRHSPSGTVAVMTKSRRKRQPEGVIVYRKAYSPSLTGMGLVAVSGCAAGGGGERCLAAQLRPAVHGRAQPALES